MSQPRNNLEALQRQLPQQKSSYFAPAQGGSKPPKFKPAKTGSTSCTAAQSGIPQLPSFSTPGYGKQKPRLPASSSSHAHSSNEAIDINPSNSTFPISANSIPYKRLSSDLAPVLSNSPKRPRIASPFLGEENVFSAFQKGKERERQTPPPSQHYALGSLSETTPSSSVHSQSVQASRHAAVTSRSFVYNHKIHTDLQSKTAAELQVLYNINNEHFLQARRDRDNFRMRRAFDHDQYILEGLLDLLEDRINAITDAIAACESGTNDMLALCKPAADFALADSDASTIRTLSHDSIRPYETPVHETQVIDKEDFGADDTYISSTSHGSNLVSDVPDNVSGANVAPDRSALAATHISAMPPHTSFSSGDMEANGPAPMTSDSRTSCRPTFAAADEFNDRQNVHHGPASDDELWNYMDSVVEDNNANVVSPEPDQPTLLFPAVASLNPRPAETPSEANLNASSHYPEVVEKLRNVFRLKAFRKNQLAAIISTLDGRDVIVLMPTGGGKSLCYQLPAVCRGGKTSGVTVVISPLRTLMTDQVDSLRSLNIDVIDSQDGNAIHELRSASKKPSLLYVTPEKLDCNGGITAILKDLYARRQLARFVIDEAHLINTWGRDFRSDGYAVLSKIRTDFPQIPIVALTATATFEALQDMVTTLRLSDYVFLSQSFNRPNLRYKVLPKKRDLDTVIVRFIKEKYPDETGIIYCSTRIKTEQVAANLKKLGLDTRHFHAGIASEDKRWIQQQWQNNECKIIVATVAFGMGVDKADVRFVIHYDAPSSIDGYCQETGRAGRDGKVAECVLYYNYADIQRRIFQINKEEDISDFQKDRKRQAVHSVNQFCLNEVDCRRMLLLNHFSEKFDPASCKGTCDNCASTDKVEEIDLSTYATHFVKMIEETRTRCLKITGPLSVHAFRGTSKADMAKRNFNTLPQFGKGSNITADLAKRLCDHLIDREILATELEEQGKDRAPISYVYLGPKAAEFLANSPSFILKIRSGSGKKAAGAPRSRKGVQPQVRSPAPTISIRKKPTRTKPPDDAIESFTPNDSDDNFDFDDIEPEPEPWLGPDPQELSVPPLLQARMLRASPSVQVVERPAEDSIHKECYNELYALCTQFARDRDCEPLSQATLEYLSLILPSDVVAFKQALLEDLEAAEVKDIWDVFGVACLDITSKYKMRMRAKSDLATFSPAEMHERFDYRGASGSKSLEGR